jgi:hypothetical protein
MYCYIDLEIDLQAGTQHYIILDSELAWSLYLALQVERGVPQVLLHVDNAGLVVLLHMTLQIWTEHRQIYNIEPSTLYNTRYIINLQP